MKGVLKKFKIGLEKHPSNFTRCIIVYATFLQVAEKYKVIKVIVQRGR